MMYECIHICIYDDHADKTIAKDTSVTDLNHRYNTQPISTEWRHQLEKKLQMNMNHPSQTLDPD